MGQPAIRPAQPSERAFRVPAGTDLVEWYFEQGWTDGLPVVPPTRQLVDAFVDALGGDPQLVECKVPPRHGSLTREVLAINMVMAGCRAEYAPIVRAAMLAITDRAFQGLQCHAAGSGDHDGGFCVCSTLAACGYMPRKS